MGQFVGLKEAQRALKQLPEFAKLQAQEAMNVTAFTIVRQAARRVKRRTGRLQSAITWAARPRSVTAVVGVDASKAFYWKYLEFGTVKMKERPFLRPAAEAEKSAHEQRLTKALEKAANQVEAAASSGTSGLL